ncbi:MAG: AAA family ATPase [Chloroflexi bacterium]|nr:AAA family ATPase [Chloroflexota bacterium]
MVAGKTEVGGRRLRVSDLSPDYVGQGPGIARIAAADLDRLGLSSGDIVIVAGRRRVPVRVLPTYVRDVSRNTLQLDALQRANAGARLREPITLERVEHRPARCLVLASREMGSTASGERSLDQVRQNLRGCPVVVGDRLRVTLSEHRRLDLVVAETEPEGVVVVEEATPIELREEGESRQRRRFTYGDVGGMGPQLQQVREVVELPLRFPEVFERLGIEAPKGVLLWGPPGCGKTLLARAIAGEADAFFTHISGPEIFHKYYGDSEAHLREVFQEARDNAPSIIFLDEIDAVASRRDDTYGDVEKRVVAQLMALMDGLERREQVIVLGATNLPDAVDTALRRPGRFDREIGIQAPDAKGRREILAIHTRRMPLAEDVDLDEIAGLTHGYVGADLEHLVREAAMEAIRRELPQAKWSRRGAVSPRQLRRLRVGRADLLNAMAGIRPASLRQGGHDGGQAAWEDVGGLREARRLLQESVEWPLRHGELFEQLGEAPPRGVLLYGPPGTGKSLLAQALARRCGINLIRVKGPALLSKWVGESEKGVRDVFRQARQVSPCILFFDEIESVAPARGGGDSGVGDRLVSQLLTEIDALDPQRRVFVLGATNRPDLVDPALLSPGRLELLVECPLPDREERLDILGIHTRSRALAGDVDLDILADLSEGYSGAELAALCRRAAMEAVQEHIGADGAAPSGVSVSARHFRSALEDVAAAGRRRRLFAAEAPADEPAPAAVSLSSLTPSDPAVAV